MKVCISEVDRGDGGVTSVAVGCFTFWGLFALSHVVLLSSRINTMKQRSCSCSQTRSFLSVFMCMSTLFWVVLSVWTALHLWCDLCQTLWRLSTSWIHLFSSHFRRRPFLSHYFDRNWISSDAFLCILSAVRFSLGVYRFQWRDDAKTLLV